MKKVVIFGVGNFAKLVHSYLKNSPHEVVGFTVNKNMLNEPENTYPLRMIWCEECSLVQIDYCVDGSLVYHPNYPYKSGVTKELVEYQSGISTSLTSKYNLQKGDLVVDIRSNDGTLLSGFKKNQISVLGIEPTNIAKNFLRKFSSLWRRERDSNPR